MEEKNEFSLAERLLAIAGLATVPTFFFCIAIAGRSTASSITTIAMFITYIIAWAAWVVTKPKRKVAWRNDVHVDLKSTEAGKKK